MKQRREPYFTPEQAASLVQGEEHRLLIRNGLPGIPEPKRSKLVDRVGKSLSFDEGLRIIAKALED